MSRRFEESEDRLRRALDRQQRLAERHPGEPDYRLEVGQTLRDLGNMRRDSGHAAEAEDYQRKALALHQALTAQHPTRPRYLLNLAWDYWQLGQTLKVRGRMAELSDIAGQAARNFEGLANDFPETPVFRAFLASSLGYVVLAQIRTRQPDAAEESIRRLEAVELPRGPNQLLGDIAAPTVLEVAWNLVQRDTPVGAGSAHTLVLTTRVLAAGVTGPNEIGAWHLRGMALYRLGRWDEAIAALTRANELEHDRGFAFNGYFVAMAYQRKGNAVLARDWFNRSVAWMTEHRTNDPNAFSYRAEAMAVLGLDADMMLNGEEAFAP